MKRAPYDEVGGFSLVEVMLAIAIVATVGIGMIGLLPTGFENVRRAKDLAVTSRIVQSISNDAQTSDWSEFANRFPGSGYLFLYYDDQGNQLEKTGGFYQVYTARLQISDIDKRQGNAPVPLEVELTGDSKNRVVRSEHLKKILVRITPIPGAEGIAVLKNDVNKGGYTEHFVIVPAEREEARQP